MGACAVPHRCLPAVFGAEGRGRLHWGSSCRVSEVSSHLGNGSSQASGKGRSAMACCQQRALDLVFRRGFLSCRHRPTHLLAFHVVYACFIWGLARGQARPQSRGFPEVAEWTGTARGARACLYVLQLSWCLSAAWAPACKGKAEGTDPWQGLLLPELGERGLQTAFQADPGSDSSAAHSRFG